MKKARSKPKSLGFGNAQLRADLRAAIVSPALISAEQEKLWALRDGATDAVWRDWYDYLADLVAWQLNRAAEVASRRLEYLSTLRTKEDWAREKAKCRADTQHWFRQWAWTLDPRNDAPLSALPFEPFDFQVPVIDWLDELVFGRRSDGVVEKSRDMGWTWISVGWVVKHWLHLEHFQALLGSYVEDVVDSKQEPDTIFEKARFMLRRLPSQMLPVGFNVDRDCTFMSIPNPETSALLKGDAPTPNFGRGGRYTAILLDEHAAWQHLGKPQWTACSQSSRSKISASTPRGRQTKQAELAHSPNVPRLTLRWRQHPWKDERWYRGQSLTMAPHEIAQEIDINYDASETGLLLKEFDERLHVITWKEFARFYGDVAIEQREDGTVGYRLPVGFTIGVGMDWGETEGHPTATVHVARPPQNLPLSDCLFVIGEIVRPEWPVLPKGWKPPTARRMAEELYRVELPWRNRNPIQMRLMSHERDDVRQIFARANATDDPSEMLPPHLAMTWEAWNPQKGGGLGQLQSALEIDYGRPNPFRYHPRLKHPLNGRPGIFFLVDDNEGALFEDHEKQLQVTPGKTEAGLVRTRAEIPVYKHPVNVAGEERKTAKKLFDDAIDALKGLLTRWGPVATPLTPHERVQRAIADRYPQLTPEAVAQMAPEQRAMAQIAQIDVYDKLMDEAQAGSSQAYDPFGTSEPTTSRDHDPEGGRDAFEYDIFD